MTTIYKVDGMSCDGCARAVESAIRTAAPEVGAVSVDLAGGRVTVEGAVAEAVVAEAVDDAGFTFAGPVGS